MRRAHLPAVAAILAAVAVVLAASGGEEEYPHRLSVVVSEAANVVPGQTIRIAGSPVGEVRSIDPVDDGHAAKLVLGFGDEAWPVHEGTSLELRWGGTVSFANRYVALHLPEKPGPAFEEGARFPSADFAIPVEFDALLRVFDTPMRADLERFLQHGGDALDASRRSLPSALDAAPPALVEADHVLGDLRDQQKALATVVRSGSSVLDAAARAQPDIRTMLSGLGTTLDAVADEAVSLRRGLDVAPRTFVNARDTLAKADPTLADVGTLATELRPGVREIRRTVPPLDDVLATVREVGPDARSTLATLRRAAPDLDGLLGEVRELSPALEGIGAQAPKALRCIRPYAPDIMAFFTNWGDMFSTHDAKDKVIRAQVMNLLPAPMNAMGYTPADAKKAFPGLEYGFPRPPGTAAGQPWFLPECGAGPDALDPSKDPEARHSVNPAMPRLAPLTPFPEETK